MLPLSITSREVHNVPISISSLAVITSDKHPIGSLCWSGCLHQFRAHNSPSPTSIHHSWGEQSMLLKALLTHPHNEDCIQMACVPSKAADRITPAKTPHTPANIHSYTHKTTACGKPNTGVNTKEMLLDYVCSGSGRFEQNQPDY